MTRTVPVEQLVGAHEIAARLGSKRTVYVHDLKRRHPDFPQPVAVLQAGMVWDWREVEKWARATGRYPVRKTARTKPPP